MSPIGCLRSLTAWNGCRDDRKILLKKDKEKQHPICHYNICGKKLSSPPASLLVDMSSLNYAVLVIRMKKLKEDDNKSDSTSFFPVQLYPVPS
jgi:hypothetical protein